MRYLKALKLAPSDFKSKYGKDSHEYEMPGGVRTSERIRRIRAGRLKATTEEPSSVNN